MTFFDSKEEVMSIVLTGYGKHKLSIGEFKPEYYAFFDNGIVYDIEHAGGGESQNDIDPRIVNNTPYLKPQPYYYGVETEYKKFHESVKEESVLEKRPYVKPPIVTREKDMLQMQIGTIDIDALKSPELLIQSLAGNKVSSDITYSSSFNNNAITQININPDHTIRTLTISQKADLEEELLTNPFQVDDTFIIDGFDLGKAISIKEDEILLQFSEDSIHSNQNNFMIEFFCIDDSTGTEVLLPLKTKPVGEANKVKINENFVESYLDIQTDSSIPNSVLCKRLKELYTQEKNVLLKKKIDCSQYENADLRFNIYGDIKKDPENC